MAEGSTWRRITASVTRHRSETVSTKQRTCEKPSRGFGFDDTNDHESLAAGLGLYIDSADISPPRYYAEYKAPSPVTSH